MTAPDGLVCDPWNLPEALGIVLVLAVALMVEVVVVIAIKVVEFFDRLRARRLDALHRRGR